MRSCLPLLGLLSLAACGKDEPPPAPAPAPKLAAKQPVDKRPLPPLVADPGGATGKPLWATGFGGLGIDAPRGVASDGGDIFVVGYFDGETDLGPAGKHAAAPHAKDPKKTGSDAYLVKLGGDGAIAWGKTFGAGRDDVANGVAVHGDRVVVVGQFLDELAIGEFKHPAAGSDDIFVAAFDRAGEPQWLWTAGGIDSDGANAVAAAPDGGWVIGGSFSQTVELQGATLKSKGGTDAMLIKLAANGDLQWAKQFGGRYNDTISHLAIDARGNIYVQGVFRDTAAWGGAPLTAHGGSDNDIVLAKYDVNGDHVWSAGFGNAFNDVAGGLAVDPAGNITMVGSFDKSVSFGAGDDHTSNGEADAFIARFTTDGKLGWARTFGADREDIAYGVAADAAGNTITTGWFSGRVDFGKGALVSEGTNKDVFAVKLDAKGAVVWAERWGDHDHDQGRAIAVDDKGCAIVAGIFRFSLGFGGAGAPRTLESVRDPADRIPKPDTFVIKLDR
ncbi:MAG TPA: SBBP repeat-containing protein [Kofleriaceae bacterium]|nr:SBBP repeat-containing protein [Kofleriaceae bacterium]